ncbi:MAG: integrase core domain-containing protein [Thermoanaerobaculia bacterium]|nr:integrase core domain-containing protein [Thermoanaerobaculia bacterium]
MRIEPGQPSQNGRHERMHKTLASEGVYPVAQTAAEQQGRFDEFRQTFNTVRPHHALGLKTPASVYHPSPRPFPEKVKGFDYPDHFTTRKVHAHGCFVWHQKHTFASRVLANERIGLEQEADFMWSVYLGPVLLARFDEREGRSYS